MFSFCAFFTFAYLKIRKKASIFKNRNYVINLHSAYTELGPSLRTKFILNPTNINRHLAQNTLFYKKKISQIINYKCMIGFFAV
jgi:hypothetical protein